MKWISHDKDNRAQYLTQLLKKVRLALLSPHTLADKVLKNDLIRKNMDCRDLIDEALVCAHLLPDRKITLPSSQIEARVGMSEGGIIYVVGGLGCAENSSCSVEKYDLISGYIDRDRQT